MELNATSIQGLTDLQLVEFVHKASIVPIIWTVIVASLIIFLLMGLILIDKSKGKKPLAKFVLIWFVSAVFIILFGTFLTFSPHMVNSISNWF